MKAQYSFYQVELFPVNCLDAADQTRRPSWGELITLSNDVLLSIEAAAIFSNQLWIGSNARVFIVGYGTDNSPLTAWELTRPRFDTVVNRGFSIRRNGAK